MNLHLDNNQLSGPIPNLNWSSFNYFSLSSNCGLVAYDATQETTLNSKDPNWQTLNSSCPVVVTKTGNGVITSTPAGITCGADCTENYASGTVVTLTATPDVGYVFKEWSGDCSGAATTTVTMDAAKNCTATFVPVVKPSAMELTLNPTVILTDSPTRTTPVGLRPPNRVETSPISW